MRRRRQPPRPPRGVFLARSADGGAWPAPAPVPSATVPTPEDERYLALGAALAARWPLIYALPPEERARVRESLRALRVRIGADRVDPGAAPVAPPAWCPPERPDTRALAGTLRRGAYRGVPIPARDHAPGCPWRERAWPLTEAGEIIPCACGAAGAILRAIAGDVSARAWIEAEIERILGPRAAWASASPRARKRWRHESHRGGTVRIAGVDLVPRAPTAPARAPAPDTWETLRARILAARPSAWAPVGDVSALRPWTEAEGRKFLAWVGAAHALAALAAIE